MQKVVEHVVKESTLASVAHSTARTLNVMQTLLANAIGYSLIMAACHVLYIVQIVPNLLWN